MAEWSQCAYFQEVLISLFQLSDVPEQGMLQVRLSAWILRVEVNRESCLLRWNTMWWNHMLRMWKLTAPSDAVDNVNYRKSSWALHKIHMVWRSVLIFWLKTFLVYHYKCINNTEYFLQMRIFVWQFMTVGLCYQ